MMMPVWNRRHGYVVSRPLGLGVKGVEKGSAGPCSGLISSWNMLKSRK